MFVAAPSEQPCGLGGVIFGQAARDRSCGAGNRDQIAARERALDASRASGEQAAALGQRLRRAGIDVDRPRRG